jgi:D-arabinose 1-dehydrogenase-like Zn-dependent alcohol dehydrogenase
MSRLLEILFLGPWVWKAKKKRIRIVALKMNKDLAYMSELFEAGKVKPVIEGPFSLDQVREAFRLFGKGMHKGKIVITVDHQVEE